MPIAKQADYPAQNRKKNKKVQFIVSREFAGSQLKDGNQRTTEIKEKHGNPA